MTTRVQDAPVSYAIATQPSGGASSAQPFRTTYSPSTSGPTTSRVDVSHFDASSGETSTVVLSGVRGPTVVEATGAEPARIAVTTGSQSLGGVSVITRDRGSAMHLAATDVASDLAAVVDRVSCDNAAFTGQATGYAGSLTWRAAGGARDARRTPGAGASFTGASSVLLKK